VAELVKKPNASPKLKELRLDKPSPQVRKLLDLGKLFSSTDSNKTSLGNKFRIILDLRGNCLAASEPFCKLLGYSQSTCWQTSGLHSPHLLDVPNLGFVFHYGAIQGLWMFLHKTAPRSLFATNRSFFPTYPSRCASNQSSHSNLWPRKTEPFGWQIVLFPRAYRTYRARVHP
jgi:hypothetical protein